MSRGIFVSYRRDDAESATHRLCDHLRQNGFSESDDLFVDIDNIPPGRDFRVVIDETLARSDVVLVVVGPRWLTVTDDRGRRRLDNSSDTHRLEVASALKAGTTVIPVRVEGADHPTPEDLPADLEDLAYRNSWELSSKGFRDDVKLLVSQIIELRGEATNRPESPHRSDAQRGSEQAVVGPGSHARQEQHEPAPSDPESSEGRESSEREKSDELLRRARIDADPEQTSLQAGNKNPLWLTIYYLFAAVWAVFWVGGLVAVTVAFSASGPDSDGGFPQGWGDLVGGWFVGIFMAAPVVALGLYLRHRVGRRSGDGWSRPA